MLISNIKGLFKSKISFIKYSLIQVTSFGIDLLIFYNFYYFLINSILISNFSSKIFSSLFSFICHRHLTFKSNYRENISTSLVKYYLFVILNIPITSFLTFLLNIFISNILFSKILADIIYFILGYFISKKFIFK